MANRVFTFLRKFFNWCIDRDILTISPMNRMKAPADEESRSRVLSSDELRIVWLAAEREGYPFGPITQLLILTAQRQQEVGAARRQEFGGATEFGSNLPIWTIPKERTKNKKTAHIVPLTEWANDLFSSQPIIAGDLDFMFTYTAKRACTAYSHAKQRIDELALTIMKEEAVARGENPDDVKEMPHWTFHDLRRTAATGMARAKVSPHVVEAVLNHKTGTIKGVAAIYNLYEYFDEKFEALTLWQAEVKRIVSGATNVVPLFRQA
jgi:integrase